MKLSKITEKKFANARGQTDVPGAVGSLIAINAEEAQTMSAKLLQSVPQIEEACRIAEDRHMRNHTMDLEIRMATFDDPLPPHRLDSLPPPTFPQAYNDRLGRKYARGSIEVQIQMGADQCRMEIARLSATIASASERKKRAEDCLQDIEDRCGERLQK